MSDTINLLSAGSAIITFLLFIIYRWWKKQEIKPNAIVMMVTAGGMLPVAVALVVHPFFPSLIESIEEMSLQITLIGLLLIFVYGKTIIENVWHDSS